MDETVIAWNDSLKWKGPLYLGLNIVYPGLGTTLDQFTAKQNKKSIIDKYAWIIGIATMVLFVGFMLLGIMVESVSLRVIFGFAPAAILWVISVGMGGLIMNRYKWAREKHIQDIENAKKKR